MRNNILFFTSLKANDPNITAYQEWSFKTWRYYAKKHNLEIFVLTDPLLDTELMRPTWQRWYVYDILKANDIEYNQVALVDIDTMVKWDTPNIFEIGNNTNYCGVKDDLSLEWINNSIEGYRKSFEEFSKVPLHWTSYINNGVLVLPSDGESFAKKVIEFYKSNITKLRDLQHNSLKKGTDQTPVNFLALDYFKDRIKYIPKCFNMTHLDKTYAFSQSMFRKYPIFIEYGFIWHFNGIPRESRNNLMKQTWELIKDNYEN